MELTKALYAFYHQLVSKECEHPRVFSGQKGTFCPDCGYRIKILWTIVKCRQCDSKRVPKKTLDGRLIPLHKFCRHCGAADVRLVKKESIDAYELVYAISTKEIDYSEERQKVVRPGVQPNVAQERSLDIVEGEVIRKRYVSQNTASAWREAPFSWQGRQAPYHQSSQHKIRNIS